MKKALNHYNRSPLKLIATCVKAATGVLGSAAIIEQSSPYISIGILMVGAVANEIIEYYENI